MVRKKDEKYGVDILRNPTTVKLLAQEIKAVSDAYISKQLSENEFREIIHHFAINHGKKLFSASGSLNPTVQNRIGIKRCGLVELMLGGYQVSIF